MFGYMLCMFFLRCRILHLHHSFHVSKSERCWIGLHQSQVGGILWVSQQQRNNMAIMVRLSPVSLVA